MVVGIIFINLRLHTLHVTLQHVQAGEKQKEKLLPGVHFRRLATGTIACKRCGRKTPRSIWSGSSAHGETLHPFQPQCDWVIYYLPEWSFWKTFEVVAVVETLGTTLLNLCQRLFYHLTTLTKIGGLFLKKTFLWFPSPKLVAINETFQTWLADMTIIYVVHYSS